MKKLTFIEWSSTPKIKLLTSDGRKLMFIFLLNSQLFFLYLVFLDYFEIFKANFHANRMKWSFFSSENRENVTVRVAMMLVVISRIFLLHRTGWNVVSFPRTAKKTAKMSPCDDACCHFTNLFLQDEMKIFSSDCKKWQWRRQQLHRNRLQFNKFFLCALLDMRLEKNSWN